MPNKEHEPGRHKTPRLTITDTGNFSEIVHRLREVTLAGDPIPGFRPYRSSAIALEEVPLDELYPCALYVLLENLQLQRELRSRLLKRKDPIDPLHLREDRAIIEFCWKSPDIQVLTPPLVEVSEDDGNIMVVTDGLHRVTLARDEEESHVAAIVARNIAVPLPFIPVQWDEVRRLNAVPQEIEKRRPRFASATEMVSWNKRNYRNWERFLGGFDPSDPFITASLMHIAVNDPSK